MKVDLVDVMGNDISVVNAARVSFQKESNFELEDVGDGHFAEVISDRDAKLIGYLATHNHWSPFGHAFATFRITAPIFVARQLVKHQVGLCWNEVSRRYVSDEPTCYVPDAIRARPDASIKQGSGGIHEENDELISDIAVFQHNCIEYYNLLIEKGVAPEQARMVLPQSMNTEWIWSGSLMAFARVCKLRLDPHAQAETQYIAEQIDYHMGNAFPISWEALVHNE